MKTSSSYSSFHSKTMTTFSHRKRLFSLKNVVKKVVTQQDEDQVLTKLEKALDKDNLQCSQHVAEPSSFIPGFQQSTIEHKLWRYFETQMQKVSNKVEREQVNYCQKEFSQIKKLVDRKREAHRSNIVSSQKIIQEKYKQIHQLFEEIKQEKIIKLSNSLTGSKRGILLPPFGNPDKVALLKDSIENIRGELKQLESSFKVELQEQERLLKEWISLLVNIIKHGLFMQDGIRTVFQEFIRVDYIPVKPDFPEFIDQMTFRCFLKIYEEVRRENLLKMEKEKKNTRKRQISDSIKNIREIAKKPDLKKIYDGTREYMLDWLKNESWKQSYVLPKIKEKNSYVNDSWVEEQRKRMKIVYEDPMKLKVIKNMLFGPKVQIIS